MITPGHLRKEGVDVGTFFDRLKDASEARDGTEPSAIEPDVVVEPSAQASLAESEVEAILPTKQLFDVDEDTVALLLLGLLDQPCQGANGSRSWSAESLTKVLNSFGKNRDRLHDHLLSEGFLEKRKESGKPKRFAITAKADKLLLRHTTPASAEVVESPVKPIESLPDQIKRLKEAAVAVKRNKHEISNLDQRIKEVREEDQLLKRQAQEIQVRREKLAAELNNKAEARQRLIEANQAKEAEAAEYEALKALIS